MFSPDRDAEEGREKAVGDIGRVHGLVRGDLAEIEGDRVGGVLPVGEEERGQKDEERGEQEGGESRKKVLSSSFVFQGTRLLPSENGVLSLFMQWLRR